MDTGGLRSTDNFSSRPCHVLPPSGDTLSVWGPQVLDHWRVSSHEGLEVTFGLGIRGEGHSHFLKKDPLASEWQEPETPVQRPRGRGLEQHSEGQASWLANTTRAEPVLRYIKKNTYHPSVQRMA